MRWGCNILVMRRAPMIGRRESAPRVSVYHRAHSLAWALESARDAMALDARRGNRASYWIVASGAPAHRKTPLFQSSEATA